jgi:hypothetical protein
MRRREFIRLFHQHGSCMAADRASAAAGNAGERIPQQRLVKALPISCSRVSPGLAAAIRSSSVLCLVLTSQVEMSLE